MTEDLGMEPIFLHHNENSISPIFLNILDSQFQKELIISFSGTKGPSELLDEIVHSYPKKYSLHLNQGAKVFAFFYDHYEKDFRDILQQKMEELVRDKGYADYKIIFTGHSLGGALAVHAAADMALQGVVPSEKTEVYTFGQPRVGNKEFYDLFQSQIQEYYRLVHHKDLVAHLPP